MLEAKLLSKVILDRNFLVLQRYNITETDFPTFGPVYEYIKDFHREYGQTPDYEIVLKKFKKFNFQVEVFDTFPYLCKALKKKRAKNRIFDMLQNKAGLKYQEYKDTDIDAFVDWIDDEIQGIKMITKAGSGSGTNYAVNGSDRKKRYQETKESGSDFIIELPYPSVNKALDGGPALSDYLLIQAFTNSGKTWIASHIAVHAWKVGRHGVLHYSPEISKQQQEDRNDTLLGHYNNVQLRNGTLTNEDEYFTFLDGFQEDEVPYLIKTMEDLQEGLSLDVIEADLQLNPNIKVVLIDGFSLMDHGKGDTSSMAKTSRRLRQIFGKYNVLGIVVNQVSASSEKEKGKEKQEDGTTLPNPAGLLGFSSTSAVIQDAAHVLSFDAVNGYGQIYIPKTRGTGKEAVVDLNCNFNSGFITEASPVDHF